MPKKRNNIWYIRFQFNGREVLMSTGYDKEKMAIRIEKQVKHAVRSGDFSNLDPDSRMITVRLFNNRGWELPECLRSTIGDSASSQALQEELTLWKAIELCLKDPEISVSPNKSRMKNCFMHLVEKFGEDYLVKEIRIPHIKQYRVERLNEGAAPATVNKEKGALSRLFQILIEMDLIGHNPARSLPNLSEKSGLREVYISHQDFNRIAEGLQDWYQPFVATAYYTGMRRGEIIGLRRSQLNLAGRIIRLAPSDTKEGHGKRVPIHLDLVPFLDEVLKVQAIRLDTVFLKGGSPFSKGQGRRSWEQAIKGAELKSVRFHDLRHTWKTNARRSGMDPEIRESILGHSTKMRSTSERYGHISDQELVDAVDKITFDHGGTKIWIANAQR
ncbi:tyrosine-type recombinase/integrase [Thermodesulfobacteriota bacterium]